MKPEEITLSVTEVNIIGHRAIEPVTKLKVDAAFDATRFERARVVTLIDGLLRKHETAMEAIRRGPKYRECQSAWMTLATAKKFILAGHQEVTQ